MRVLRGWIVAVLVVAAAFAAIQFLVMRPRPVDVRIARLVRGKVEETVTNTKAGAIRSRLTSDLSVETAGLIVGIHAREGAVVRRGGLLVSIDRRDADAALAAAKKDLAVLESLAAEAKARHADAVRERDRLADLRKTDFATQAQLDQAGTQVEVTAAATAAALSRADAQKTVIARAEIAADKCDLRAPFDGTVTELHVEVGEWAVPGKLAMRLIDLSRLYVRAEMDEVDIGNVKNGLAARVTLDPYKNRKLLAHITRVAPYVSEIEEQNRTVEVELEFVSGHEGLDLKPGTSADVEVILREKEGALRIPTLALLEGNRALIVGSDRRARAVPLQIGLRNWEFAEVLGGMKEGDPVIVSLESENVKEGVEVRIVQER